MVVMQIRHDNTKTCMISIRAAAGFQVCIDGRRRVEVTMRISQWQCVIVAVVCVALCFMAEEAGAAQDAAKVGSEDRDVAATVPPSVRRSATRHPVTPSPPTYIPKKALDLADHVMRVCGLLFLSAVFAGLTMGIMGFDSLSLEIIAESGPKPDCNYAQEILPLRRGGHQTLCTLIVSNMLANVLIVQEMSFVQADVYALIRKASQQHRVSGENDGNAILSFVLSTLVILIFTEVLPMSLCKSKHALHVAALGVPIVRVAMVLTWPIVMPLGKLLDVLIAHDAGQIYDRNELKKLMRLHYEGGHAEKSGLAHSEVALLVAAMEFHEKKVKDVMTPVERVFFVNLNDEITPDFLERLWRSGRSRVPVAREDGAFCDVLLVRDLITYSKGPNVAVSFHAHAHTVRDILSVKTRNVPTVDENTPLHKMLSFFERVNTHMAIVHRELRVEGAAKHDDELSQPAAGFPAGQHGDAPLVLPTTPAATPTYASRCTFDDAVLHRQQNMSVFTCNNINRTTVGIITLEDIVEELILQEIYDEYDSDNEVDDDEHQLDMTLTTRTTGYHNYVSELHATSTGFVRIPRPPAKRPRVNFYSYYVHDNEDVSLSDGQWWALAYYLVDTCPLFANWRVGCVRQLLDEHGDLQLRPVQVAAAPASPMPTSSSLNSAYSSTTDQQGNAVPSASPSKRRKNKSGKVFHDRQSVSGNFGNQQHHLRDHDEQQHTQSTPTPSCALGSTVRQSNHLEDAHKVFAESAGSDSLVLYQKGCATDVFTIVLSGSVSILVGRDGFVSQVRSFRWLAMDAIISDLYVPEFTAIVRVPTRLVKIRRDRYEAVALHAHRPVATGIGARQPSRQLITGGPKLVSSVSSNNLLTNRDAAVNIGFSDDRAMLTATSSLSAQKGTAAYGTFAGHR